MSYPNIGSVFSLLDKWRNLPAYQLERRADIFFGLFLPDVLDDYLQPRQVNPRIIPEFPLPQENSNRTDKTDYFVLSSDGQLALLVELKTDSRSRRNLQDKYLSRAKEQGMANVLSDLKQVFKATSPDSRGKYFHLMKAISKLGLVTLPEKLEEIVYRSSSSRGLSDCIDEIELASSLPAIKVVYILPEKDKPNCIDFERVADVVESRGEIGQWFATYLRKWRCITPGASCH